MFKGCYRLLWGSPYCLLLNIECRKELLIARSWFWWIVEMWTCYCTVYSILTVLSECFAALRAFSCSWWHFLQPVPIILMTILLLSAWEVGLWVSLQVQAVSSMVCRSQQLSLSFFLCQNISKNRQFIPFSLLLAVFSSLVLITRLWTDPFRNYS